MTADQFLKYFEDHISGSDDRRHETYAKVRNMLITTLEKRGITAGMESYNINLEALESAIVRFEARHNPTTAVHSVSLEKKESFFMGKKFFGPAIGIAASLVVGVIAWNSFGVSDSVAQAPRKPAEQVSAPAPAAAPARTALQNEIDKRYGEAEKTFDVNAKAVEGIATALDNFRRTEGRLPETSGTFVLWPTVAKGNDRFSSTAMAPTGPRGTIIYRSDGRSNYKVLVVQSGDCVVALLRRPDLVDAPRAGYGLDCTFYGRWTPDAATW